MPSPLPHRGHNAEILGRLGLSSAEIDALEADGIIGGSLVT